jgi:hypothetical protein
MDELERIKELGSDLPEVRDEAHDAARAALLEHIAPQPAPTGARQPRRFRRALGLAGAVAAVAAVVLIVFSSGGTPAGQTVEARAAELEFLAKITPNQTVAGPWWSMIGIEAESAAEGRTAFYYEPHPEHPVVRWDPRRFAEFRWRSQTAAARVAQLESEGWAEVGTQDVQEIDIAEDERTGDFLHDPHRLVRIFSPDDAGPAPAPMVGVWEGNEEGEGRAFELETFSNLRDFELVSERLQKVDSGEFISDARPGLSIKPFTKTITKPNGETEQVEGAIVGAPPPHAPDTPEQERRLYRRLFLNDAGEAPIVRSEDGRTWMLVRRYAPLSDHWLKAE